MFYSVMISLISESKRVEDERKVKATEMRILRKMCDKTIPAYSPYYAEPCNELAVLSSRHSAKTTQRAIWPVCDSNFQPLAHEASTLNVRPSM